MPNKLLITGCDRSGNTLMHMLCANGFESVYQVHWEKSPIQKHNWRVIPPGYRWGSFKCPSDIRFLEAAEKIKDLFIIIMIRDPRAVFISKWRPNGPYHPTNGERWILSVRESERLADHPRVLTVRYEDLIETPNNVQHVISRKFGLHIKRAFTECYEHFDASDSYNVRAMRGIRPIDESRLRPWENGNQEDLDHIELRFKQFPDIPKMMKRLGYK